MKNDPSLSWPSLGPNLLNQYYTVSEAWFPLEFWMTVALVVMHRILHSVEFHYNEGPFDNMMKLSIEEGVPRAANGACNAINQRKSWKDFSQMSWKWKKLWQFLKEGTPSYSISMKMNIYCLIEYLRIKWEGLGNKKAEWNSKKCFKGINSY